MNKFILCTLISMMSLMTYTISAKEKTIKANQVPQLVQDGFKGKYHEAIIEKWMTNNTTYSVLFNQNGNKFNATYNAEGKWMNTSSVIKWEDVPETVKNGFRVSRYKDWTIYGSLQIDSSDGTKSYAILVDNTGQLGFEDQMGLKKIYKVYFKPQGNLVGNIVQYNYSLL